MTSDASLSAARRAPSSTDLDLMLEGSFGEFCINGTTENIAKSLSCLYFQTTLALNPHDPLLRQIRPVREIFPQESLEFDEIMQRDLDDYRITTELIPYLLDDSSKDIFKLFPPIVISLLPWDNVHNKILPLYPTIKDIELSASAEHKSIIHENPFENTVYRAVISGSYGNRSEKFAASWPLGISTRDTSCLKINTSQTKLVIVDGQHRAMALLALYRNLYEKWEGFAAPYEKYYSELWPRERLMSIFNSAGSNPLITIPCIICIFPGASEAGLEGDTTTISASRSIFLVLNKNARKVTSQRLTLLDDDNLISHIMRKSILAPIKSNSTSQNTVSRNLRIYNILLDESKDKVKITNEICISSVSNINQMLETLLLSKQDEFTSVGIKQDKKIGKRADLLAYRCHWRLGTEDDTVLKDVRRSGYSNSQADELNSRFSEIYGNHIINMLEEFAPYKRLAIATLNSYNQLSLDRTKEIVRDLLFGNQGQYEILDRYSTSVNRKFGDSPLNQALIDQVNWDKLKAAIDRDRVPADETIESILCELIVSTTEGISTSTRSVLYENGRLKSSVSNDLRSLYSNVYKTSAFQTALICTFFMSIESYAIASNLTWPIAESVPYRDEEIPFVEFLRREYIENLNAFFAPRTAKQLAKLFSLFIKDQPDDTFSTRSRSFTRIYDIPLISEDGKPREMDPHLWPAYRYVLTEIWVGRLEASLDEGISAFHQFLKNKLTASRNLVYTKLVDGSKLGKAIALKKDALTEDEVNEVKRDCSDQFTRFLTNLGVKSVDRTFVYSEDARRENDDVDNVDDEEQDSDHYLEGSEE